MCRFEKSVGGLYPGELSVFSLTLTVLLEGRKRAAYGCCVQV